MLITEEKSEVITIDKLIESMVVHILREKSIFFYNYISSLFSHRQFNEMAGEKIKYTKRVNLEHFYDF